MAGLESGFSITSSSISDVVHSFNSANATSEKSSAKSSPKTLFITSPSTSSDSSSNPKNYLVVHNNIGTSNNSPSPILRDSSSSVSRQESLSNHSQHVCHTSVDQESVDSPISLHYCSSPDRSSPIEGPSSGYQHQSYYATSLPGLPLHPALQQVQSYQQSVRNYHHQQSQRSMSSSLSSSPSKRQSVASLFIMLPESNVAKKTGSTVQSIEMPPNQQRSLKLNVRNTTTNKTPSPVPSSRKVSNQNEENLLISATPHGIENILSRPLPRSVQVTPTDVHPQLCSTNQYTTPPLTGLATTQNAIDFPNGINASTLGLHSSSFGGVYWPSLQTFIDNPALQAWRGRFQTSMDFDF